jgi:hypothetical protein
LTGLLFVAVSINVERILRYRGLPERGLETLLVLLGVVVVSTLGLVPGQGRAALGGEVLAAGLLCAGGVALLVIHNWPPPGERKYLASHLVLISPGGVPACGRRREPARRHRRRPVLGPGGDPRGLRRWCGERLGPAGRDPALTGRHQLR